MRSRVCCLVWAVLIFAPQASPQRFSPWYAEALRDILKLEDADVAALEQQLAANPEDLVARLKLLAYHQRGDRVNRAEDRAQRVQHVLWLIERHPDSELLRSPVSRFSRGEVAEEEYRRAVGLWATAARARSMDAAVLWNAALFFQSLDSGLYLNYLEATAAADPNHAGALRPLADFYALSLVNNDAFAARSQAALEASKNVWVLGNAAYMLQSQYNRSMQLGAPNPRAEQFAERYYLRALALDPKLDRKAILPQLPQLPPQPSVPTQPARGVVSEVRRLPVDAFPELPPTVAGVLRARGCTVPQPSAEGARNVVRGTFFAPGEMGWAVLCSVNGSTALLAFRNDRDTAPQAVITYADGASREIIPVNRDFIVEHYRAFGGPEPPPITHQGIDDAFLEKASVVWYFHEGKWLQLQGAD